METIQDKYKGKSPCQMYGINDKAWQLFVKSRLDPSWQV